MAEVFSFVGTAIQFFAKKILGPVIISCGMYTLILYILSKLVPVKSEKARKFLRTIAKPPLIVFRFLGGLPALKIIVFGAGGLGLFTLIGTIIMGIPFILCLLYTGLIAAGTAFGLFCILLACKGFAAAIGYVYAAFGDEDTYVDTVRDIDGKFIVYADEDPSMYPEDMVTRSNETRAEAEKRHREQDEERNRIYKEQKEAQRRYFDAKKRYDSAGIHYRSAISSGDMQDALRWKAIMDQALIDMNISGYKGL